MGAQLSKVLGISCGTNAQVLLACCFDNQSILRHHLDKARQDDKLEDVLEAQDDKGITPLMKCAAKGSVGCLQMLVDEGANLHRVSYYPHGTTALHEAIIHRNIEAVIALVTAGACPTLQNCKGETALDLASQFFDPERPERGLASILLQQSQADSTVVKMQASRFFFSGFTEEKARAFVLHVFPSPVNLIKNAIQTRMYLYDEAFHRAYAPRFVMTLDDSFSFDAMKDEGGWTIVRTSQLLPKKGIQVHYDRKLGSSFLLKEGRSTTESANGLNDFLQLLEKCATATQASLEARKYKSFPPGKPGEYSPVLPVSSVPMYEGFGEECICCMTALATFGYKHGDTVHRCVCEACAIKYPSDVCPSCRQPVQEVVKVF